MGVLPQRHDGTGNNVGRTEIAAHRIQGDLHAKEILRSLAALCKMKIRPAFRPCLRRSGLAGPCNSRTRDKPCDPRPCCRTAGIWSFAVDASDWPLCACAAASSRLYVWGLPCEALRKAEFAKNTTAHSFF